MFTFNVTFLVVNETAGHNTAECIKQLAAYGAVCLTDNNERSPVDILLNKNRTSEAETLIQLTCKKILITMFASILVAFLFLTSL